MAKRTVEGLAVSTAEIQRGDRVVTADGSDIGSVRKVCGTDVLDGHILVVGWDDWDEVAVAYAIPCWALSRRDNVAGRLHLCALRAYVCSHWARASALAARAQRRERAMPAVQ